MIKQLLLGVWLTAATVGGAMGAIKWQQHAAGGAAAEAGARKIVELKTKPINVPVIENGAVQGYVLAHFVFTVDEALVTEMGVSPEPYLTDEAFKTIYAGERINFRSLKRQDLPALAASIGKAVNKRLGGAVVRDVLIDQISYIPRGELRGANERKG